MMIDEPENNEFRELLSDYAQPIDDDGFAAHVLAQSPKNKPQQNTALLKNFMLSGATLMATLIAVPQLGKLQQLIAGIKLPEITLPMNVLEASGSGTSSSSLLILALMATLLISIGGSFVFGKDL